MLTDGALRMLVLLHFHRLGFSPVQLAYLFVLYEVMGIVTNLSAGWIAARFGLTATLYGGLAIQIVALLALSALDPRWTLTVSVIFVMGVQGLSGIAKDLSKMSSKSAVKLLAPADDQGTLFKWVAILTGSKNAVKGFGFMLGAALLALFGFDSAVLAMAAVLAAILLAVMLWMPAGLPKGRKSAKFSQVFSKNRNVNTLSAARLFLFGARDCWFVVGIPIFFYGVLHRNRRFFGRKCLLHDRRLHGLLDHFLWQHSSMRAETDRRERPIPAPHPARKPDLGKLRGLDPRLPHRCRFDRTGQHNRPFAGDRGGVARIWRHFLPSTPHCTLT